MDRNRIRCEAMALDHQDQQVSGLRLYTDRKLTVPGSDALLVK